MKNIEQILKDAGLELTDEQKKAVNDAVAENYKPIADYNKQVTNKETAETERDSYKAQLDKANESLEKFKDYDPAKQAEEIENLRNAAKEAQDNAKKQLEQHDQRDFLKEAFDKKGITSERIRKSLMADIMGEDGLKWKNGAFLGLDDYLKQENETEHFYQTDEEKKAAEEKEKAAGSAPRFTAPSEGKPAGGSDKPTFNFGFTPIREVPKKE